jgi:transposase InsO family protein|tara:strand:- start:65 stop:868 length:804 start_codon:yes stop_codon:yes gene_type:complete
MTGTSKSGHYYKSKNKKGDGFLLEKIREVATEFPCYGYRRITAQLRRDGIMVNRKRVHRIMVQKGLLCTIRRKYRVTTNSKHGLVKYPNLIAGLIPVRTDELWHSDITYIRLEAGFAYLAAIIDGFSRKVVGYALGRTLSPKLTIAALNDAIGSRDTASLTHHSDQGFQYCSREYIKILKSSGIAISMSGKANPYDNAKMESFFRTLKVEEVYMSEYRTYEDVLNCIPYFIEEVYNSKRLHSSLGYMPPEEFEDKFNKKRSHQLVLT